MNRLSSFIDKTEAQLAIGLLSNLFAACFHGYEGKPGITPQKLEESALNNKNLILDQIVYANPMAIAGFRSRFSDFATKFKSASMLKWNKETQREEDAHVYSLILQHPNLSSNEFDEHIAVILKYLPWYYKSLDQAIDWFSGKQPER